MRDGLVPCRRPQGIYTAGETREHDHSRAQWWQPQSQGLPSAWRLTLTWALLPGQVRRNGAANKLPMLEEAFQRFADGIALRWSQQVLQLLVEGPSLNLDARGEYLCNPLQGGEGRGGARGVSRVRVCKAQVERKKKIQQTKGLNHGLKGLFPNQGSVLGTARAAAPAQRVLHRNTNPDVLIQTLLPQQKQVSVTGRQHGDKVKWLIWSCGCPCLISTLWTSCSGARGCSSRSMNLLETSRVSTGIYLFNHAASMLSVNTCRWYSFSGSLKPLLKFQSTL